MIQAIDLSCLADQVKTLKKKITQRGDLPLITVDDQIKMVDNLAEFPLGQSLLQTGVLTGYFTYYVVTHPEHKDERTLHPFEKFLLEDAPLALATQERYQIFRKAVQSRLKKGIAMASIPCGMMSDLLTLNYSGISNFSLVGVDQDPEVVVLGKELAKERGLYEHTTFYQEDIWQLEVDTQFDVIVSNGLNIYLDSAEQEISLYKKFYSMLTTSGILITSYLTLPPGISEDSEWRMGEINPQHALKQKIILKDILEAKFQNYHSTPEIKNYLEEGGFKKYEIIYDKAHIFPTVIAYKS